MRRNRLALVAATLALLTVPGAAAAVDPTQPAYGDTMTGAKNVPAIATAATGQGTFVTICPQSFGKIRFQTMRAMYMQPA